MLQHSSFLVIVQSCRSFVTFNSAAWLSTPPVWLRRCHFIWIQETRPGKLIHMWKAVPLFTRNALNQTHTHTQSCGTFDEGVAAFAERLNTHGLFCFLSRCLPFFLHPSWWWRWHWLSLSVRACVVFARLWMLVPPCDWLLWCHSWFDLAGVRLPFYGLPCHHACVCACIYLFVCLRVAPWLPLPGQYFYFQEVLPVLAAKHCIMQANAELHQSVLAKQKKRFGEEIARLQVHSFHMTSRFGPTQFIPHILK